MVTGSLFPTPSIDRKVLHWEDHILDLSPVDLLGGIWFKREDTFAPLGYGGINGSKLRQCIWLVSEYIKGGGRAGLISATSVKSPQLPMGSAVAEHFGLRSVHYIGATKPATAIGHQNVAMATWFGAEFGIVPSIAYNPVLQRKVNDLRTRSTEVSKFFYLEYGITLDHKKHAAERIEQFHRIGSEQVRNLPDTVENLIIPAGSCNSTVSILYGLARFRPKNLKRVFLIGIGPPKLDLIEERLEIINAVTALPTRIFHRNYVHWRDKQEEYTVQDERPQYELTHYDLHSTRYVDYQDERPFSYKGIDFHPTYEGKVMTWLCERRPDLLNDKSLFWIVGSKPSQAAMAPALHYRTFPTELRTYAEPSQ